MKVGILYQMLTDMSNFLTSPCSSVDPCCLSLEELPLPSSRSTADRGRQFLENLSLMSARTWNEPHCDSWMVEEHEYLCVLWVVPCSPHLSLSLCSPTLLETPVFLERLPGVDTELWALRAHSGSHLDAGTYWLWTLGSSVNFSLSLSFSSSAKCF